MTGYSRMTTGGKTSKPAGAVAVPGIVLAGTAMALLGALTLAGCTSEQQNASSPPTEQRAAAAERAERNSNANGVRLALLKPRLDANGVGLEGFLNIQGECVYVTQRGSSGKTLLAFDISGVTWDAERNRLVVHGETFAPEQKVDLGGSPVTGRDQLTLSWIQPPAPACDRSSIFVANSIGPAPERPQP